MESTATAEIGSGVRPVGWVEPEDAELLRALRVRPRSQRFDGKRAATALAALPDGGSDEVAAWWLILRGLALTDADRLVDAESSFLHAAARTLLAAAGESERTDVPSVLRLAARAFHHLGCVHRRQDRADMAETAHHTALRLRDRFGSFEELSETADELGLDCDVARRFEDARRWYEKAIGFAERAVVEPLARQAVSWGHLSSTLGRLGEYERAVLAARSALELRRRHAPGAAMVAQAAHHLAHVLLRLGEHLADKGVAGARPVLQEATELLTKSCEELTAFGPTYAEDVESGRSELEFAARLMACLST